MKKVILTLFVAILGGIAFNAKANDVGNFYVNCKVKVADDSNGRGTVYFDTTLEDERYEQMKWMPNQMPAVESRDVEFTIITVPADGYVFANFTDQYGNPHYYNDQQSRTVSLTGYSEDINNPTFYELSAHFVPAGELPEEEYIEVTVPADKKFGTFIAPVKVELPDELYAYKVTGVTDEAVVLEEIVDGVVPPFTAVLLENLGMFDESVTTSYNKAQIPDPLPSMTTGLLTGTFEDLEVALGNYILDGTGETSEFVKLENEVRFIDAYTCYMSVENGGESYIIETGDTGIENLLSPAEKTEIYDMQGRKLDRLNKGLNIVNGMKVLVK